MRLTRRGRKVWETVWCLGLLGTMLWCGIQSSAHAEKQKNAQIAIPVEAIREVLVWPDSCKPIQNTCKQAGPDLAECKVLVKFSYVRVKK